MKLKQFEVKDFRSVKDSGPIETGSVTALIGVNESGKSNLLLPLWKFRPAMDGEIKPTVDYPRKLYNDYRNAEDKPVFIDCTFEPSEEEKAYLANLTSSPVEHFQTIRARRKFDGKYYLTFPDAPLERSAATSGLREELSQALTEIQGMIPEPHELSEVTELETTGAPVEPNEDGEPFEYGAAQEQVVEDFPGKAYAATVIAAIERAIESLATVNQSSADEVRKIAQALVAIDADGDASPIALRYTQLRGYISGLLEELSKPVANDSKEARRYALNALPHFVYYTNYGNLDSEIYLPHVIANINRTDLGGKEEAKVRTLKVLFDFVGLKPEEILELGKDFKIPGNRQPTEDEINEIAEKKKERSILLQAASTKLTKEFREWWKQGTYSFRFEADGDHFRIWVSDEQRTEEIELESRSTGLQWFLSCYLVLAVESKGKYSDSILLLDEPGMTLHPLAQRDLAHFFDRLARENQIIYTTHSPFLVDGSRLDRARKVYVSADGTTKVAADLKHGEADKAQRASGYAVLAALGITVSESLLPGSHAVVVEDLSDQVYLSAIKTLLIASGRIRPTREIIFQAAGKAEGVKAAATLLGGREEDLPVALFDSNESGSATVKALNDGLYAHARERVLQVGQFIRSIHEGAEIEDLMPSSLIVDSVDRLYRGAENLFADSYKTREPITPQIEAWAKENGVDLTDHAWKVELAKRAKQTLLNAGFARVDEHLLDEWQKLFAAIQGTKATKESVEMVSQDVDHDDV